MKEKDMFSTCPLCCKTTNGCDKHNNVIWCDDLKCALAEEVSFDLWIALHKKLKK